jgi:DNA-binding NtrC family response regulator
MVGESSAMRRLLAEVGAVAKREGPVLLQGERGTGKKFIARALHTFSARRDGPFVQVDCGSLPQNLIGTEIFGHLGGAASDGQWRHHPCVLKADGGTLFLDELGELPRHVQAKLVRLVRSGTFVPSGGRQAQHADVRIIAAAPPPEPHESRSSEGLDPDLLAELEILEVPPLRERTQDLPRLTCTLLYELGAPAARTELSRSAWEVLLGYRYPGNIDELRHMLETALVLAQGARIEVAHLPRELYRAAAKAASAERPEEDAVAESSL